MRRIDVGRIALPTAYLLALAVLLGLFFAFAFRSQWLPTDEGLYALAAERFLLGEVPHRDFQVANHPDLDLGINAAALKIFGSKLSSLRWPAGILVLFSTFASYVCLRSQGAGTVFWGTVWVGAVSFVAVPSPSASIMSNAFLLLVAAAVHKESLFSSRWQVVLVGLLLGVAFGCRQLGAGLMGCALLSWGLSRKGTEKVSEVCLLGRAFLILAACIVTTYVLTRSDLLGKLLLGLPGVILVWQAVALGRPSRARTFHLVVWTSLGFLIALSPLALYFGYERAFSVWCRDVFVSVLDQNSMAFEQGYRYSEVLAGLLGAGLAGGPLAFLHLAIWIALFLGAGWLSLEVFLRRAKGEDVSAYMFCGPILAISALHYEILIYLFWALPLPIMGLCGLVCEKWKRKGQLVLAVGFVLFLNCTAGKPVWLRSDEDLILTPWGKLENLTYLGGKADLYVPPAYANFYGRSLGLISELVPPGEQILSIPFGAEWYFLSDRPSATSKFCLGLYLKSEGELEELKAQLLQKLPSLVIFRSKDKYNTPLTLELRRWVGQRYRVVRVDSGYEFLVPN